METKPTLHYYFAHQYLRDLAQGNFAFLEAVIKQGPQTFETILKRTFENLKRYDLLETDLNISENDFSTSVATLGEQKTPFLLVKMPDPRHTAEASYIGFTLMGPLRYFTVELHVPDEAEKQINPEASTKYLLGEWDQKQHKLLSESWPVSDPAKFSGAIEKLLK